jgi:hypothetical protein
MTYPSGFSENGPIDDIARREYRMAKEEFAKLKDTREFQVWRNNQFSAQYKKCAWCKQSIDRKPTEVDHIIPLWVGGSNEWENLVLSCPDCNAKKGSSVGYARPKWIKANVAVSSHQLSAKPLISENNNRKEEMVSEKNRGWIRCPKCDSDEVTEIFYGYIPFPQRPQSKVAKYAGPGGCLVSSDSERFHCKECGNRWKENDPIPEVMNDITIQTERVAERKVSFSESLASSLESVISHKTIVLQPLRDYLGNREDRHEGWFSGHSTTHEEADEFLIYDSTLEFFLLCGVFGNIKSKKDARALLQSPCRHEWRVDIKAAKYIMSCLLEASKSVTDIEQFSVGAKNKDGKITCSICNRNSLPFAMSVLGRVTVNREKFPIEITDHLLSWCGGCQGGIRLGRITNRDTDNIEFTMML